VLTTKPKSTVTIPVVSSNQAEGMITSPTPATLTFDTTNWNDAQSIIVTGQDDAILDPDTMYSIQIGPPQSTDTKYSSLPARSINLVNADDELP
jgi:large repetitive protein